MVTPPFFVSISIYFFITIFILTIECSGLGKYLGIWNYEIHRPGTRGIDYILNISKTKKEKLGNCKEMEIYMGQYGIYRGHTMVPFHSPSISNTLYTSPFRKTRYTVARYRYAICLHLHLNFFLPLFLKIRSANTELSNFKR